MALYEYTGRDNTGILVSGQLDAESKSAAAELLIARAIVPIKFDEVAPPKPTVSLNFLSTQVSLDELHIFTRQMYSLVRSGIPLLRGITGLAETATSKIMQQALYHIGEQLKAGKTLASAMKNYPDIFNSMYISMIHVGENTGKLEDIFMQLSLYIEREQETRKQIKAALRYPSIILTTIIAALAILNLFVIPQFASMFAKLGAELPLPTKILIASSNFFIAYWPAMLIALIGSIFLFRRWINTDSGGFKWDKWKLKMPLVGSVIFKATISRYCQSLSMMLGSGVSMTQSLTLVSDAVDNAYMGQRILNMKVGIERGESMLRVSKQSQLFTPLVLQMISVGEETGQIEALIIEAAEYYEREVEHELKSMTTKIEPILIGFISAIVLVLALGIYLPMWGLMDLLKT